MAVYGCVRSRCTHGLGGLWHKDFRDSHVGLRSRSIPRFDTRSENCLGTNHLIYGILISALPVNIPEILTLCNAYPGD